MSPIRVLVVDDSSAVRRMVTTLLDRDPAFEVVGTAENGRLGVEAVRRLNPDAVTLDIEMPQMDGIAALREIRRTHPRVPVIMFSTLTERGARATLDALAAGASDYVTKPHRPGTMVTAIATIREQLLPKLVALVERQRATAHARAGAGARVTRGVPAPALPVAPPPTPRKLTGRVDVVAIGCSTGGPEALPVVLRALPERLAVPVVVVQHMPPMFTTMLAARLDGALPHRVVEAAEGMPIESGTIYLAPGDYHFTVLRSGATIKAHLEQTPPENYCRPAVDVLFRSVAATYQSSALAVVLTGMGSDGAKGAERMRTAGAGVIAQDEASSVVWGMPGAVVRAGFADRVLPLTEVGGAVTEALARGRAGSMAAAR